MSGDVLDALPTERRSAVQAALADAFGARPVDAIAPVTGGASGACLLRAEVAGRRFLLRAEGPETPGLPRNPHRYVCARMAADAGVGPAMHYIDEASGVAIADFIEQRPLSAYPGGARALAQALGELLGRVQGSAAFPALVEYPALVAGLLDGLATSGGLVAGALDPHLQRLAEVRAAYEWNPDRLVSSHNDAHRENILFDGERLWLIDWESAYRNDPLVDVAIMLDSLSPSADFEAALLRAWLGREPDATVRRQLELTRALTRLYYACFLLGAGGASREGPDPDVAPPDPQAFLRAVRDRRLAPGAPETLHVLGKIFLNGFLTGAPMPELQDAAAIAG